jgi:hypothetical protein
MADAKTKELNLMAVDGNCWDLGGVRRKWVL